MFPSPVTIQSPLPSSSGQNRSPPSPKQGPLGLTLNDDLVNCMEIGAVFNKDNNSRINSLDFHRTADLLVRIDAHRQFLGCADLCSHLLKVGNRQQGLYPCVFEPQILTKLCMRGYWMQTVIDVNFSCYQQHSKVTSCAEGRSYASDRHILRAALWLLAH